MPILSAKVERGFQARDQLSWPHPKIIRRLRHGPLLAKGLLRWQDAQLARDAGRMASSFPAMAGGSIDDVISPLSHSSGGTPACAGCCLAPRR